MRGVDGTGAQITCLFICRPLASESYLWTRLKDVSYLENLDLELVCYRWGWGFQEMVDVLSE